MDSHEIVSALGGSLKFKPIIMTEDTYEERPKLYNKITIVVFSILLSTFFGGILYSQNLSEIENRKQMAPVLIFCIIWNILSYKFVQRFTDDVFLTLILPNITGGLVLTIPFWKHHFGEMNFKNKSILLPSVIVFFIYGLFAGLRFFGK